MDIKIIKEPIKIEKLKKIAQEQFGDLVKAVVDVEREIMAVGGELHTDEEALLLQQESKQESLWGINLYPEKPKEKRIEFDSLINIRPSQDNRSRDIESPRVREKIKDIVGKLVL